MRVIAFGAEDYPAARSSTLEVCQSRPACIRSSSSITVRALAHPVRFDRKTVRFRAKYGGTWEGRWLSDDHSDDHCDSVGELVLPGYAELAERYGISKLAERTEDLVRDGMAVF